MIFRKLRKRIGEFLINRKFGKVKRNIKATNLNSSKTVAIIFKVEGNDNLSVLKEFLNYLVEKKNLIETIGFGYNRLIPLGYLKDSRLSILTPQNTNLFFFPKNEITETFINKEFDLLIDLSNGSNTTLKYILAASKAKFKVGKYTLHNNFYDLMIDTSKNDDNFAFYIDQIKHFLTNINYK